MVDTDKVKEQLSRVRYIDKEIDAKEEVRVQMEKRLTSVKATQWREIDVQGGVRKTTEDRILEYIEYSEHINELIDQLVDLKMTVVEQIENVDDGLYRTILTERYINNKNWEEVAKAINYSERRTLQYHNDALREFAKVNKDCGKLHCNAVKIFDIVKIGQRPKTAKPKGARCAYGKC